MPAGGELGKIDEGGGYDLSEIQQAREAVSGKTGDEKGFDNVEPIFIQVTNNPVFREEELEARSVIIEYDEYGEVVSVELL
jgi:hypothetical protein